jgi:hypothetical protein
MTAHAFIGRVALPLALGAALAGCNLIPKQEDEQQAKAPEGTVIVPVNAEVDQPKDAQGQPVDKGDGPVLQALGSLAGVDLGPRIGGCTFQHQDGRELLVTGAAQAQGVEARGAVRSGGVIVMLKSIDANGLDALHAGPTMVGSGLTVQVKRAAGEGVKEGGLTTWAANMGVSDAIVTRRIYSPGRWVCE